MTRKQSGFTLIELMIVVAIIGILAAIAIPRYQDYVARSQMSEAISLTSGLKTAVAEIYAQNGTCPANGSDGIATATDINGSYVASVTVGGTAPGCTIQALMKNSDVSSDIQNETLTLLMGDSGGAYSWTCSSSADQNYLSKSCSSGDTSPADI